jgi:hypothetical protein
MPVIPYAPPKSTSPAADELAAAQKPDNDESLDG